MWSFNAVLDHEVPCGSIGCCFTVQPDGTEMPCDSAARAKDCTGMIPAGQLHYSDDKWADPRRFCRFCVREMNDQCDDKKSPLLVRVDLTYSDGTVRYLEGDAADDWLQQTNGAAVMAWAHGQRNDSLPWKSRRR